MRFSSLLLKPGQPPLFPAFLSRARKQAVFSLLLLHLPLTQAQDLVSVVSRPASRTVDLPAEIQPYLTVALHAKVSGYVERVLVDRGSIVKQGELLAELTAPEMAAQIAEAQAKVQSAEADRVQAEAQRAAAQTVYESLVKAAETPGAVAGNEILQAKKQVEADDALIHAREESVRAAQAAVHAIEDMQAYLKISAPFDGVLTDRFVHPGALVGPNADSALFIIQQVSRLRLVVPVPEEDIAGTTHGASISFHVPGNPERTYSGTIARIAHALDPKTRTMPIELDVTNRDGSLAPGMFPTVKWPVRSTHPALFVPKTSVVTTTERTFVVRNDNGRAEWVDVKKGPAEGDLVEVTGALHPGDKVIRRATDEFRDGSALQAK